jgi:hypothetical protein
MDMFVGGNLTVATRKDATVLQPGDTLVLPYVTRADMVAIYGMLRLQLWDTQRADARANIYASMTRCARDIQAYDDAVTVATEKDT